MTDFDRTLAGCVGDPEAMFAEDAASVAYNRRVCGVCPVQAACRQWALDHAEPWGMWGGLTPAERERLLGVAVRQREVRRVAELKPCGTAAAVRRHQRRGEVCVTCRQFAARQRQEEWPRRRERENAARAVRRVRAKAVSL
jgi:hypothetical protein